MAEYKHPEVLAAPKWLAAHLDDPSVRDALPEMFYTGRARLHPTHRAGHIPTARNLPATANVDRSTQTLLPPDELARLWRIRRYRWLA